MKIANLNQINELRKEIMGKYYRKLSESDLNRIISQKNSRLLTYHVAGTLVGMTFVYLMETLTRKVMCFEELVVDKDYRNMGIGTKIMNQIIELAKMAGTDCIEGCTKNSNKIAQKLYKNLGFEDRKNIAYRLWLKK